MVEGSYSTKSRSNGYYIGRSSKNNSLFYSRISIECFFFPNIFCFFSMLECFPFYFTCLRRRYRLGFGAFFDSFSVFRCTVVSSFFCFFHRHSRDFRVFFFTYKFSFPGFLFYFGFSFFQWFIIYIYILTSKYAHALQQDPIRS
jgi:hypothetical protein